MPYSYKTVSPYYSDVKYPSICCSPTPKRLQPSPPYLPGGHQRGCGVGPSAVRHEEESDAQPLDLSLRTKPHEPVAKKPRLDHNYPDQVDYPRTYPCSNGGSLAPRTSPYTHYSTGASRSPRHASSPSSGPHESPYAQRHSPSPVYYAGSFITGDYHIPRSSPSVVSSSPSPYALTPSSNNVHSSGSDVYSLSSYADDHQRPLIHNYGPSFRDADYCGESRKIADKEKAPFQDSAPFRESDGGLRFIYRTCEPDSINGKQPSTGHLAGKNKEGSELSRLLAPGRPPEVRSSPTYEHRSTTPGMKHSPCSVQPDQVSKALFPTKDSYQAQFSSSTNQAPEVTSSLVQCSASVQSQPRSALRPPAAPANEISSLVPGGAAASVKESAPKIISKKSLLLERTAGLYHTVNSPGDGAVAKLLEKAADSAAAVPAEEEGKEGSSQKISLLDFWISKILMERSEEAPKKPCSVDYVRRTVDGQRKIRISLVDLIELQVEHSLKA